MGAVEEGKGREEEGEETRVLGSAVRLPSRVSRGRGPTFISLSHSQTSPVSTRLPSSVDWLYKGAAMQEQKTCDVFALCIAWESARWHNTNHTRAVLRTTMV